MQRTADYKQSLATSPCHRLFRLTIIRRQSGEQGLPSLLKQLVRGVVVRVAKSP